jgi:ribose/xylose/arabinose/galactoside ABC-type transport system permease subunit
MPCHAVQKTASTGEPNAEITETDTYWDNHRLHFRVRSISLWNPQQWFNWGIISNIGQYTAILGLLAIGQTFVILIREIDLSVGSVYGIVGITFVGLENSNVSVLVSFILAMLLALLIGLVNAIFVIRGKLSSMIVMLGGLFFTAG